MKQKQMGFSLLELVMVILLISLISVVAVPSMQTVRRQELNQFAKKMALDLQEMNVKQSANSDEMYTLELQGTSPNYYGYTIRNGAGVIIMENMSMHKRSKIRISAEGEPAATAYTTLIWRRNAASNQKELLNNSGAFTTPVKVYLQNSQVNLELTFDYVTGRCDVKIV